MSGEFRINKSYAEKYNSFRQKEEFQRLKDKYGDLDDESDSSTSESEDENAEALTDQLEKDWLRTLAALKAKDPKIYKKDVKFYKSDDDNDSSSDSDKKSKKKKKKQDKPVFLKDYNRKLILEKGGIASEDESDDGTYNTSSSRNNLGYHEEQEKLRKSLAAAVSSSEDESSDDGLLTKADKTRENKVQEEEEYLEWMKGQKSDLTEEEVGVELAPLKNYWNKPDLDEGEKFLKNFILNKQYMDQAKAGPSVDDDDDDEDFSEEEELLTRQETFERKYNFRFEEPEAVEIRSYPRTMEDSLRRKDTTRKDKREKVKDRKGKEKEKKMEELKQLKNFKRQEILDKIEKLKQITGNQSLGIDADDLDEDFDPEKHDEMMQKCFDEDFYGEEEGEEKPEFPYIEEAPETWDNWTGDTDNYADVDYNQSVEPHVDDPDFVMDADYDPEAAMEAKLKKKQKKKKKNKLAQALATEKPVFDPNEKTFEEYLDEYYKLDYEDIIGDLPCRFKYRKVTPNNFGLTTDEILKAKDKELNKWVSVKKMVQYRTGDEEEYELRAYASRGNNTRKKQAVLCSLFESEKSTEDGEPSEPGKKKRKKKKKNLGTSTTEPQAPDDIDTPAVENTAVTADRGATGNQVKRTSEADDVHEEEDKPRKKQKTETSVKDGVSMDVDQLKSVGKKGKKKKKKQQDASNKEDNAVVEAAGNEESGKDVGGVGQGKNKKKKKNKGNKSDQKLKLSDERLKAYGINPKKYKYMQKDELHEIKPRKEKKE